jgi:GNAT superfamily N-acetyltransferase
MGRILPYRHELGARFRDLNLQWLEEFFYVEEHDRVLLEHCEQSILDPGGHIFFYEQNGDVVGTFALIPLNEGIYELGKMAVDKDFRGQGIGQQMLVFCIDFARKNKWQELLLYSNRNLKNSLHIYRKYGFEEVPIEKDNPYERGNIKMSLSLDQV